MINVTYYNLDCSVMKSKAAVQNISFINLKFWAILCFLNYNSCQCKNKMINCLVLCKYLVYLGLIIHKQCNLGSTFKNVLGIFTRVCFNPVPTRLVWMSLIIPTLYVSIAYCNNAIYNKVEVIWINRNTYSSLPIYI